ncbi:MAG TPA: YhjD/YihY/BrkB family envelope integrity protein [Anaeromyxobacteraceae bacterium]|jgi:membrane protein|nr:YhjD/YihY/BrkB family envelope integrity protein [Anaeromyxobacteraceae bacterium]
MRASPFKLLAVASALRDRELRVRAMALTYTSLFALVPALVVAFSVVQAFTGMERLWARVHEFLLENLAVGARAAVAPRLDEFVKNAHATSAGLVGGALLVWSAVSLFSQVERAVNDIWTVRKRRPLVPTILTYWAGLTLGPLLLGASLALGHGVLARLGTSPVGRLGAGLASVVLTCTFFTVFYLIIPATRVRPRPAVVGGLVAGVAWELAKAIYAVAVARFFHYHAVYGSLAAVPIFLLWIFVSWTIFLFGARVTFVVQHARALMHAHPSDLTAAGREQLAARTLREVGLAYRAGAPPLEPAELADRLSSLAEPVREALTALRQAGLVLEAAGGGYVPGRPLEGITLADVRRATSGPPPEVAPGSARLGRAMAEAERAAAAALGSVTLADVCDDWVTPPREQQPGERPVGARAPGIS